ncbi:MAG: putative toxin-antitoxin system toxin component, PIN family [Chloroflexi bacterium]|nr:putative toxin-antitoxin system toxin component, PIN family [Chloroflexota bacterium]
MPVVAVVDTNVWVSAFLNPGGFPDQLLQLARRSRFALVTSSYLLEELQEVLSRPRIMKIRGTTLVEARNFTRLVANIAELVAIGDTSRLCRDPDDDALLQTALEGRATFVVSRDEDLTRDLELTRQLKAHNIQAITVNRFLKEIG